MTSTFLEFFFDEMIKGINKLFKFLILKCWKQIINRLYKVRTVQTKNDKERENPRNTVQTKNDKELGGKLYKNLKLIYAR